MNAGTVSSLVEKMMAGGQNGPTALRGVAAQLAVREVPTSDVIDKTHDGSSTQTTREAERLAKRNLPMLSLIHISEPTRPY